jgi:hypothetical protein
VSDDANLTPEQEADLRRLLAEARHDDPVPDDVAARLDRVLAQLAAADSEHDPDRVVELASRRRRNAATLLVAAAAIIAVGLGISRVIPSGGDARQSDTASSAATARGGSGPEAPTDQLEAMAPGKIRPAPVPRSALNTVSSNHFTTDVRRVGFVAAFGRRSMAYGEAFASTPHTQDAPRPSSPVDRNRLDAAESDGATELAGQPGTVTADGANLRSLYDCAPAAWGRGRLAPVLYDGEPAVLAFRKPMGDSQVVDLLECGTGDILRSVTLPRP